MLNTNITLIDYKDELPILIYWLYMLNTIITLINYKEDEPSICIYSWCMLDNTVALINHTEDLRDSRKFNRDLLGSHVLSSEDRRRASGQRHLKWGSATIPTHRSLHGLLEHGAKRRSRKMTIIKYHDWETETKQISHLVPPTHEC